MTSPAPPYPADTRAKGWRFEIDLERVRQSDTWALAAPELRPWLLMLWCEAWMQAPCGSLPGDDDIICARIGMPAKLWAKHRATLLRGWSAAADGRLYHDVIASQVRAMLSRKEAEKARKAEYRARMDAARKRGPDDVPPLSHGTDTGPQRPSGGSDATGTGTGTGLKDSYGSEDPALSSARASPPMSRGTDAGHRPSPAAAVCIALKAAGIGAVNPGHPRLLALLDAGATVAEFERFAAKALQAAPSSAFAYVLGAVEGERERAAVAASRVHRGPMPGAPISQGRRAHMALEVMAQMAEAAAAKVRSEAGHG